MEPILYKELKDTRSGFGVGLLEAGKRDSAVFALCADVTGSLKMGDFIKEFPERFVQVGIAEANMVGISAGLALSGKIPFAGAYAAFISGRVYDQIRMTVAYSNLNVKLAASHSGITVGEDGATHQMNEDIALMKALPNMVVLNPCDYNQTKMATIAAAEYVGPVYLRFGRPEVPNFTLENEPFIIGKAILLNKGTDVSIFATGHLVYHALEAAEQLRQQGISAEVINIHTIKPLDEAAVLQSVSKTKCVVTAEEHALNGGMGDSICQLLARKLPAPVEMVGIDDIFAESGTPEQLMIKYKLTAPDIAIAVRKVMARK
ncbi:MAG TPA: transketolase C-terminal domain-containing protein [Bacteroidales bacterium]|nr:transketolase C-terminal domain-containing protein [Bacteroidales bacterium]HOS57913.1 transketolase C-terminal domain-containing protein [Bacteroidales bacterium]HRT13804.1 transketolase C-terminal domain-containing protein [Bacteroidales bacterium]HXK73572.1 transketolase C-terminal domain-containing protein [Bacteroidales bacterium]